MVYNGRFKVPPIKCYHKKQKKRLLFHGGLFFFFIFAKSNQFFSFMAKGNAMGLWRGKKGTSVFYTIKNSKDKQRQGIRERNYTPSNPQSYNQAGQRMKMSPAQKVYNILKPTIQRSWQGVSYGPRTRFEYLRDALKQEQFPAVAKGDPVTVPGPYLMAKGSLGEITGAIEDNYAHSYSLESNSEISEQTTIGSISENLLLNPGIKEGDQITIVICYGNLENSSTFYWDVISFYVDTNDSRTWADVFSSRCYLYSAGSGASIRVVLQDYVLKASAIIQSRDADTPLRSTSRLLCNYTLMNDYYSEGAKQAARRSYMKPLSTTARDWEVDPEEEEEGTRVVTYANNQVTVDFEGGESQIIGGVVAGGGDYYNGETVTMQATNYASANASFVGWYESKEDALASRNQLSTNNPFSFTAGTISEIWAKFEINDQP